MFKILSFLVSFSLFFSFTSLGQNDSSRKSEIKNSSQNLNTINSQVKQPVSQKSVSLLSKNLVLLSKRIMALDNILR